MLEFFGNRERRLRRQNEIKDEIKSMEQLLEEINNALHAKNLELKLLMDVDRLELFIKTHQVDSRL